MWNTAQGKVGEAIDLYFDKRPLMDADVDHETPNKQHYSVAPFGALAAPAPVLTPLQPPVAVTYFQ
jgi:hypothetical protein